MPYSPHFTPRFLKDIKSLDRSARHELERIVTKILENTERGKPLSYHFKGCQSERVGKFRIIYQTEGSRVIFVAFGHRKKVYKR
jgi:mRNA interferase RelE/StbE